jgi:hypothetical protein
MTREKGLVCASQAQCSADGARNNQKWLEDEGQFDERDRCERQKEAERTANGGLHDGAPERHPPHQEPHKSRNANEKWLRFSVQPDGLS